MKRALLVISLIVLIGLVAGGFWISKQLFAPMFVLNNHLAVPVRVNAFWREESKELGEIAPNGMLAFDIQDEASIEFQVHYPDGQVQVGNRIYFTPGLHIRVDIYADQVEVNYRP